MKWKKSGLLILLVFFMVLKTIEFTGSNGSLALPGSNAGTNVKADSSKDSTVFPTTANLEENLPVLGSTFKWASNLREGSLIFHPKITSNPVDPGIKAKKTLSASYISATTSTPYLKA